jgi:hypothetical protein
MDYAWGLVVSEYKGLKVVEHGGAWVGFRAALVRFPEQKFSVIILANLGSIDPSGLAFKVADIYLEGLIKEPAKQEPKKDVAAPAFVVPKSALEALTGNWQDKGFGLWLEVSMKDGRLVAALGRRSYPLTPLAPGKFIVAENPAGIIFEVTVSEEGKPLRARLAIGTSQEFHFEKATPLKMMGAAELAEYTEAYVSEELLDARYSFSVEEDTLVLKTRTVPRAVLKAMAPDKFMAPGFGLNIEFVRDGGGKIVGFALSVGRAADIAFAKQ